MKEYYDIVSNIITDARFKELKNDTHHNTNKYDHLVRVSKLSYKIAKHTKANVKEVTTAGILHDFFHGGRKDVQANSYLNHPFTSAKNAKECFNINDNEVEIIKTHMFHHTFFRSFLPFINLSITHNASQVRYNLTRVVDSKYYGVQTCIIAKVAMFFRNRKL